MKSFLYSNTRHMQERAASMKKTAAVFALFIVAVLPAASKAKVLKVFHCSGEKVEIGDSTYSVLKRCGEPAYSEDVSAEGCDRVENWYYDCKGRGFVEILQFKAGVLSDRSRGEDSNGVQECQ